MFATFHWFVSFILSFMLHEITALCFGLYVNKKENTISDNIL